jgi:hypothetical protein
MKNLFLLTLCMSVVSHCFGQILPQDFSIIPSTFYSTFLGQGELGKNTSRIELDLGNKNKLHIFVRNIKDLDKRKNIDSLLALFVKDYQVLKPNLKETTAARSAQYSVSKNGKMVLDLQEFPQAIERLQYRSGGEPVNLKTQMDTLKIVIAVDTPAIKRWLKIKEVFGKENPDVQAFKNIYFYFIVNQLDDLAAISTQGVNPKINEALADIKAYKGHDIYNESIFNFSYRSDATGKPGDDAKVMLDKRIGRVQTYASPFLNAHFSVGVGLIKDQWTMNFQQMFSFIPNQNKRIGYSVGATTFYNYEFEAGSTYSKRVINSFNQIGVTFYNVKSQSRAKLDNWIVGGIYLGYLHKAQGSLFQDRTVSLSATIWARSLFKIQPEVYIPELFNKKNLPTFGLRLQVGI